MFRSSKPAVFAAFLIVVISSSLSCGSGGPTLYKVRGKVTVDGQPAEGATVILEPVNSSASSKPSGVVEADGSFSLSTHPFGNGAPAGEYAVLITWYPPNARESSNPKNKLPAKYSQADKTPVPKFTVKDGANEIPTIAASTK